MTEEYPLIAPAILTDSFEKFTTEVRRVENLFPYAQIDVMDGLFVLNRSFSEIKKVNEVKTNLKYELHLMVENPLEEIKKWKKIKNVFRAIFHIESLSDPIKTIQAIRANSWQAGIAVNPDTPLQSIESYLDTVNLILFMTVFPGTQGAAFQGKLVKDKIIAFTKLKKRPLCAVDGGITRENISEVRSWGVEIFNIGSRLVMVEDIKNTYRELRNKINV